MEFIHCCYSYFQGRWSWATSVCWNSYRWCAIVQQMSVTWFKREVVAFILVRFDDSMIIFSLLPLPCFSLSRCVMLNAYYLVKAVYMFRRLVSFWEVSFKLCCFKGLKFESMSMLGSLIAFYEPLSTADFCYLHF